MLKSGQEAWAWWADVNKNSNGDIHPPMRGILSDDRYSLKSGSKGFPPWFIPYGPDGEPDYPKAIYAIYGNLEETEEAANAKFDTALDDALKSILDGASKFVGKYAARDPMPLARAIEELRDAIDERAMEQSDGLNKNERCLRPYTVSVAVDGRIDLLVAATDPMDAKAKAEELFAHVDLGNIEVVGMTAVNCTDENDEITDY